MAHKYQSLSVLILNVLMSPMALCQQQSTDEWQVKFEQLWQENFEQLRNELFVEIDKLKKYDTEHEADIVDTLERRRAEWGFEHDENGKFIVHVDGKFEAHLIEANRDQKKLRDLVASLEKEITNFEAIEKGSVIAFTSNRCPQRGWEKYDKARGSVIVGVNEITVVPASGVPGISKNRGSPLTRPNEA